jgi:hypothetical protein
VSASAHPLEAGQVVLDCRRCGNPAGGRHAPGCTPRARLAYALLQHERASDRMTASEAGDLTATITALHRQAAELSALRDRLCRQVWGCTYMDLP